MRRQLGRTSSRRRTAITALVVVGLVASIVAGVFLIEAPVGDLPVVSLGSEMILVVERAAALFAVWLLILVVLARALAGELPAEISGRGLRYADAATAQHGLVDSERVFESVRHEIRGLQEAMTALEAKQDEHSGLLRRYAMTDGDYGH